MTQISDTEPGPKSAPAARTAATRLWTREPVIVVLALLLIGVGYAIGAAKRQAQRRTG